MVRKIDTLGRITLPFEMRQVMGLHAGMPVQILFHEEGIVIKKYDYNKCDVCGQEITNDSGCLCFACRDLVRMIKVEQEAQPE